MPSAAMNTSKRRYLWYGSVGLIFGVFDWFYLNWLADVSWGSMGESILVIPVILLLNYGIWLAPIIPATIFDARRARQALSPMLAGALTWSCAMLSYYTFYAILLSTGRLEHLEHLSLFGERGGSFWLEYWAMFNRIILSQFLEWIGIAVIGGGMVGALAYWFVRQRSGSYAGKIGAW